jgi:molecular chaperone Hsp33
MPDCPDDVIAALEKKVTGMPSVTDLLRNGETPETILQKILGDMDLHFLDTIPAKFECNCSRERVTKALIALGRKELASIIEDGKEEKLNCAFCNTDYVFTVDEMREILKQCGR